MGPRSLCKTEQASARVPTCVHVYPTCVHMCVYTPHMYTHPHTCTLMHIPPHCPSLNSHTRGPTWCQEVVCGRSTVYMCVYTPHTRIHTHTHAHSRTSPLTARTLTHTWTHTVSGGGLWEVHCGAAWGSPVPQGLSLPAQGP